jgi:hypothetical protein
MLSTHLPVLNRSTASVRKSFQSEKDSKGSSLFKQATNNNESETINKKVFSRYTREQKEELADEFVESAGKDGVNLLAKTPEGQHALAIIYDHVSDEAAEFLRQAHADQGATAVN